MHRELTAEAVGQLLDVRRGRNIGVEQSGLEQTVIPSPPCEEALPCGRGLDLVRPVKQGEKSVLTPFTIRGKKEVQL